MKILNIVDEIFFQIAKWSMFASVLLITANAGGRYFINQPITGAYEITEGYLMVVMVFLSISYTWKEREHIAVTFISDKFPTNIRNIIYLFILLVGAMFFGIIGYLGMQTTLDALVNQYAPVGLVSLPIFTSVMWVPLGCLTIVLRMILEFVTGIVNISSKGISNDLFEEFNVSN